ncbi:ERMES complex subunit [Coemansia sp. RSA 720]|nr:ERMES complex subunit [Coemansia sp. RSA 720]
MSFKFQWTGFPAEFNCEALEMLTRALNKGENKPANLVGPIVAKELDLGSTPPELDILEISELEEDRFRAMFRMKYSGDGYLVLQTQVQANPLRLSTSPLPTMPGLGVVAAAAPLVVPMLLRISGLKLNGIVVLAVSKDEGITLVFRSDPLVSVEVHSTFDSVPSVRRMLQREIEATLRSLFREDLPLIVHEMSVNEIRRAREARDRERREHIEQQQMQIRTRHEREGSVWTERGRRVGADSGAASVGSQTEAEQRLLASQLHQRLIELSKEGVGGVQGMQGVDDMQGMYDRHSVGDRHSLGDRHSVHDRHSIYGSHSVHDVQSVRRWTQSGEAQGFTTPPQLGHRDQSEPLERYLTDDWERMQHSAELDAYLRQDDQRGVVLRPSDSAVAARLASLMNMGQTLSPYTRRFEHTTMRSDVNPPRFGLTHRTSSAMHGENVSGSPPLSLGDAEHSGGLRQPSFGTSASTPFSALSPPSGGIRSPFSRNRKLRRKVHRIGGISLSTGSVEK